jgi:hypothetical protein
MLDPHEERSVPRAGTASSHRAKCGERNRGWKDH